MEVLLFLDTYDSDSTYIYNEFVSVAQSDTSQINAMANTIQAELKSLNSPIVCVNFWVDNYGWFAKAGALVVYNWNWPPSETTYPGDPNFNPAYISNVLDNCGA